MPEELASKQEEIDLLVNEQNNEREMYEMDIQEKDGIIINHSKILENMKESIILLKDKLTSTFDELEEKTVIIDKMKSDYEDQLSEIRRSLSAQSFKDL